MPVFLETNITLLPTGVASNNLFLILLNAFDIAIAISRGVPVGLKNLPSASPGSDTSDKSAVILIGSKLAEIFLFTAKSLEPVTETLKSISTPLSSLSTANNLPFVEATWNLSKFK